MRIKIVLIIMPMILNIGCNRKLNNNSLCDKRIKEELKILSKAITIDKSTKVYTLNYLKLPPLSQNEFRRLSDSLQYASYLPHNENQVKHFLYCIRLENLSKLKCQVKISDIRKYYGVEFDKGTKNGQIHTLYYVFNNSLNPNCYSHDDANSGKERKCSILSFQFNEEQILKKVNIESFAY
jgi:hypothetical protein